MATGNASNSAGKFEEGGEGAIKSLPESDWETAGQCRADFREFQTADLHQRGAAVSFYRRKQHRQGVKAINKRGMNPNSLANLRQNSERTREQLQSMGRKGGVNSGRARRENRVTITLKTTDGEIYTIRGATPEKAAAAIIALEEQLYLSWHRIHDKSTE